MRREPTTSGARGHPLLDMRAYASYGETWQICWALSGEGADK
ncbi:MAG TPA: hypothetical protein VF550_02400 [Polyangia bacterium]